MATETTLTSAQAWHPDVTGVDPDEAVPEALILKTSTIAGHVEGDAPAVRVQFVTDDEADFVAEGSPIPEADPDLAEVLVHTGKVAQLLRLSREQWVQEDAATTLSTSVQRAVIRRADKAYVAQPVPTSPAVTPPAGLLNVAGILDGGEVATDLDILIDTMAQIESNGGTPSHLVLSPTAWASLQKFKASTGSAQNLLGAGTHAAERLLLDVPVLVSNAVPAGTGLILDQSAIASVVGDVMVAVSDQAYFTSDSIALRCTWRFGANLVHPNRVAKFTVTAPAA